MTQSSAKGCNHLVRLLAFYLPQFHPIPENDRWWGEGFTEWTNATKTRPLFPGHYQPHLPGKFGYYDLRVRETRHAQIRTARQFGIDGFCYHYYWFSGTRLLHQPVDDMLADPASDMPFCLCWANENWTRRWNGAEHEVLIAQQYLPDDDINFVRSLAPFFADSRYIRIEGKPILVVYRPQHLPDAKKTVSTWRDYCRQHDIGEIHLCAALTHGNDDYRQFGFDSGLEFPPHNLYGPEITHSLPFYEPFRGRVFDYTVVARFYLDRSYKHTNVFRGVVPSWDNTARTGNRARLFIGASPDNYQHWLSEAIYRTRRDFPGQDRFVFINAWNEWAEGCHLEPDSRHGLAFLEATKQAKQQLTDSIGFAPFNPEVTQSGPRRHFWSDVAELIAYHGFAIAGRAISTLRNQTAIRRLAQRLLKKNR